MKITIITLQNIRNYGSTLQALATQKIFEKLGLEVEFVDYRRKDHLSKFARINRWTNGFNIIKKAIYTFLLYPTFSVQDKKFSSFISKYLHVKKGICCDDNDFKKLEWNSDFYCTGSDQTWNSKWNGGILPPLFLSFAPQIENCISYAASFGKEKLDDWELEKTKKLLKKYKAISVREASAVNICNELGYDATLVLDPTLQLDKEFWKQYAGKSKYKEPYVLIYQLNTNAKFDKYAKEFAKRKGYKLVRFCTRLDQAIKCGTPALIPNVLDFVNLIYHAKFVITDSFHATAFSININTNFLSIYPEEFSSRLASILKLTQLENRHLKNYDDFSFVEEQDIDFSLANAILAQERDKGWNFLKQAIDGKNNK